MKFKYYILAIISNLALLLYSLPWTYGANHIALRFYMLAFIWFMFGWVIILVHLFLAIKLKRVSNQNWRHHLIASILIIISYIGLFVAFANGYMVTV